MVNNNAAATVSIVKQFANNGRYIRTVTRVTIYGRSVTFMERLPKAKAIAQAREVISRG